MPVNNAVLIHRELISRITKLFSEGNLELKIDRIPLEMRPKDGDSSRCCIYKDRAMLRYKIMALLGFDIREEDDELTPLADYVGRAWQRTGIPCEPLTVVDDVCSACVRTNYVVTNMCRGCMARPCMLNCPKDAIYFEAGQAQISHEKCVNCGICQKSCPFHAIIYVPVPCEESCPVGAISKREDGTEKIDYDKCIYCGKCVASCPFGAVMEKSHIMDVFNAMRQGRKLVAMVAPAIAGQFKAPLASILGAIKQLGFDEVVEVAKGADLTTENEAREFIHKMEDGQQFMTTSCCPSYTTAVKKHIPELAPFVSDTLTPMQYTARLAREQFPDAVLVFVGPCLAKRHETYCDPNADFMLSFAEIGSMFVAKGIDVAKSSAVELDRTIDSTSRGYPVTSGVMTAVKTRVADRVEIVPLLIDGIDKARIRELKALPKNCNANMVEVMACAGGCVNGCNVIANPKVAVRQVGEVVKNTADRTI
ncbi:MAG: monomeric [FeFe] hydrogenase [Alistipes sp.]|nr:monomeric [FeFe] hydrogenase [Alistipes sp.]